MPAFVPHIYSAQVFVYNPDTVKQPPQTMSDLLDPKWKGKIGMVATAGSWLLQAASMHDLVMPLLLPGIKINTSPTDFYPIQSVRLARFDGETWKLFGDVLSHEGS